jgi:hypothetical protein
VNTALVERHNATDRNRNTRKARKTYCFSKDWWIHRALTFFTMYSDNFCWPIRPPPGVRSHPPVRDPVWVASYTDSATCKAVTPFGSRLP